MSIGCLARKVRCGMSRLPLCLTEAAGKKAEAGGSYGWWQPGPGLAEGIEAELPAHDAEFPDMARLYKLPNAGADFQEDIGRFALSAGELAHIAALAKPVKWAHGDAPESVAVRFAYAHGDQATPVLFSIEGSFPCYGPGNAHAGTVERQPGLATGTCRRLPGCGPGRRLVK